MLRRKRQEGVSADNHLRKQLPTDFFFQGYTMWSKHFAWTKIPSATSQMCKEGAQLDVANVVDLSALKISICMTW